MNKLTEFLVKPFLNEDILEEGARDPGIFKAIFLAGGPGSGKSYVASQLFGIPEKINVSKTGLKMVNQDSELEFLLNKYFGTVDLDSMPDELFQDLTGVDRAGNPVDYDTSGLRKFAKSLSKERLRIYTEGRLGVIIDGTGHKFSSVKEKRKKLMDLGYDTYMVFVNTSLEVAMQRNEERPRALPAKIVKDSWRDVQSNLAFFQGLFGGSNFLIVDNNKFLSEKEAKKKFKMLVNMGIEKFLKKPIKSKVAKSWLRKQKKFQKVFKDPGQSRFFESVKETIKIDVNVGDTIKVGRFKNKKVFVKSIGKDKHGMPTINGKPVVKFRMGKDKDFLKSVDEAPRVPRKKGQHRSSKSHSDLYTDENPKGTIKGLKFATVKDAKASVSKIRNSGRSHAHKIQQVVAMEQRAREMGKTSQAAVYRAYINKMKKKTKKKNEDAIPSPSRKMVKKMKKMGNTSVPYGSGYKKVNEQKQIKKVVGIYGGRFQPFGPHHKKTYEWLKKRADDVYITTTNIKQPPRHPMNFKEKVRHMMKMGVPKNRIVQEVTPYVAKNTLSKYDPETTAVVYIFGKKDAGRLKGGTKKGGGKTYYQDYKKNKSNLEGFEQHGYILTAPHVSVNVGGKEVSGTVMRELLGSPKIDEKERPKLFKQAFGYFDKGIYNMMTNKFKKLFEEFKLSGDLIQEFLIESTTAMSPTDDGPPTFYRGFDDYRKFSNKWIDDMYAGAGWKVLQFILGKHAVNPDYDYTLKYSIVPAVAYGRKQSGDYGTRFGVQDPINTYKDYIDKTVLRNLGYEIVKWMGITPDGRNYTGVEVETPVYPGVGQDNVGNTEETKLDIKERISLDKEVKLLIEGGAYGHMNHPFDDKNITFSDLKNIIILGLGGKLNREDGVTEKLDGQNLMVSWVKGKLVTARNKGQLKNFGATSMDIKGVASKFAGRGDIRDAFVFAMKDLNKSIGSLSEKQKEKIFGNGKRWMNLEVMYPKSANVIDYDKAQIVFHGTLEYDESGTAIGQPSDSARMLAGMIKQVNQDVQKHYKIGKPQFLQVPKVQNFGEKKKVYLNRLKKLQNQYRLKDNDTLALYHQKFWEEFIFNASKQMKYKIPRSVLVNLTKRWAFFDKSYKIPTIRKDIDNKKFLDWALSFDKNDHSKWVKQNMKPFEVLFFDVGAEILKNISGYLAASPKKAVQKIRKDVINAIKTVKSGGDIKKIETLKHQLDKLEKIGGLSSIVPSEGIVFKYKGKTYKFTGAFAPVNQILGLLNF